MLEIEKAENIGSGLDRKYLLKNALTLNILKTNFVNGSWAGYVDNYAWGVPTDANSLTFFVKLRRDPTSTHNDLDQADQTAAVAYAVITILQGDNTASHLSIHKSSDFPLNMVNDLHGFNIARNSIEIENINPLNNGNDSIEVLAESAFRDFKVKDIPKRAELPTPSKASFRTNPDLQKAYGAYTGWIVAATVLAITGFVAFGVAFEWAKVDGFKLSKLNLPIDGMFDTNLSKTSFSTAEHAGAGVGSMLSWLAAGGAAYMARQKGKEVNTEKAFANQQSGRFAK